MLAKLRKKNRSKNNERLYSVYLFLDILYKIRISKETSTADKE